MTCACLGPWWLPRPTRHRSTAPMHVYALDNPLVYVDTRRHRREEGVPHGQLHEPLLRQAISAKSRRRRSPRGRAADKQHARGMPTELLVIARAVDDPIG